MPMSEPDRIVWAAIFARTNYGQSMPHHHVVMLYRNAAKHGTSLGAMVNFVCADFMENEEHYEMFYDEAKSWYARFKDKELEDIFKTWPEKRAVWEASEIAA